MVHHPQRRKRLRREFTLRRDNHVHIATRREVAQRQRAGEIHADERVGQDTRHFALQHAQ
jgi:hypothetical protein